MTGECVDCGGVKLTRSTPRCWECEKKPKRAAISECVDCRGPKRKRSAVRCRECYKRRNWVATTKCFDCGKPIFGNVWANPRCKNCETSSP